MPSASGRQAAEACGSLTSRAFLLNLPPVGQLRPRGTQPYHRLAVAVTTRNTGPASGCLKVHIIVSTVYPVTVKYSNGPTWLQEFRKQRPNICLVIILPEQRRHTQPRRTWQALPARWLQCILPLMT